MPNFSIWARRGIAAVADQGLFAVSNFIVNVLLARWLGPREYGAFALAFAVLLFFSLFHTALVSEPMLVYGASRYRERLACYLGNLTTLGGALSLLGSLGMLAAAAIAGATGSTSLASALLGFALACPPILYLWLMRRACYVLGRPQLAVTAGILYLVLLMGGLWAIRQADRLSPGAGAVVIAIAALGAGLFIAVRLRAGRLKGDLPFLRDLLTSHWEYGRWATGTALLSWLAANLFTLLLPLQAGLEGTGALTALVSLVMPAIHAETALSLLILPPLSERRGTPAFGHMVRGGLLVSAGGALLQWVLFGLFHAPLTRALYGHQYDRYAGALWILGLIPVFFALTSVIGTAFRALEMPRRVFVAQATAAVVAIGAGWALIRGWGFAGAAFGYTLSYATAAVALWLSRGPAAASASVLVSETGGTLGAR